jgi:hypothetical protein
MGVAIGVGVALLVAMLWVLSRRRVLARAIPEPVIVSQPGAFARLAARETHGALQSNGVLSQIGAGLNAGVMPAATDLVVAGALLDPALTGASGGWLAPVNKAICQAFVKTAHAQLDSFQQLSATLDVTHVEAACNQFGTTVVEQAYCLSIAGQLHRAAGRHLRERIDVLARHTKVVECFAPPAVAGGAFSAFPSLAQADPLTRAVAQRAELNFHPALGHHVGALAAGADHSDVAASAGHASATGIGMHIDTVPSVDGGAGVIVPTVPIATLLVSSYREARLLLNDDTVLAQAAKNVAIDGAGVAAGAKGGAIAGLKGGALAGPHIAVVAAIFGAVAGGIGGKFGANWFKSRPLKNARDEFLKTRRNAIAEAERASKDAEATYKRKVLEAEAAMHERLQPLKAEVNELARIIEKDLEVKGKLAPEQIKRILAHCQELVQQLVQDADAALHAKTTGLRAVLPRWLVAPVEYRQAEQLRTEAKQWQATVDRALQQLGDGLERTEHLLDLVLAVPGSESELHNYIAHVNRARAAACVKAKEALVRIQGAAASLRERTQRQLSHAWEELKREYETKLEPLHQAVNDAADQLDRELRRAGKGPLVSG